MKLPVGRTEKKLLIDRLKMKEKERDRDQLTKESNSILRRFAERKSERDIQNFCRFGGRDKDKENEREKDREREGQNGRIEIEKEIENERDCLAKEAS